MYRLLRWTVTLTALTGGLQGQAAPAPWYWWISKLNSSRVCAQVMPSQGWSRAEGPFTNAQCTTQRKTLIRLR